MKNLLLATLCLLAIQACKKDDTDKDCSTADWIGTYTGTETCSGTSEAATYSIAERGGDLYVTDGDGNEYKMDVDGCNFDLPTLNVIIGEVSGNGSLSGEDLNVTLNISALGFSTTCRFEGSK